MSAKGGSQQYKDPCVQVQPCQGTQVQPCQGTQVQPCQGIQVQPCQPQDPCVQSNPCPTQCQGQSGQVTYTGGCQTQGQGYGQSCGSAKK
ncbi:cornifin alpha-like isoform X2 [Xenopus tropicalis]|uniref:Cornifin alpha-like isoform X2 n=1 Tax=Xenopus tropicalis TaxID=8364 RepID=A0A8J1JV67_XENTR|nr:cornifin alpha-like isoform X2 [Xenopus tropicalis]